MSDLTISILLYGELCESEYKTWYDFYRYAKKFSKETPCEFNYLGIMGEDFQSGKVTTVKRTEKRLLNSIEKRNTIESISLYSLPLDFTVAAFDYDVYLGREEISIGDKELICIILSLSKGLFEKLETSKTIEQLKEFLLFNTGEVIELSKDESAIEYSYRINDLSSYESLKIISILQ
jgi:hypothetical protein